jgi:hypothetical protein
MYTRYGKLAVRAQPTAGQSTAGGNNIQVRLIKILSSSKQITLFFTLVEEYY